MTTRFPNCELCGEPLDGRGGGTAEMYNPNEEDMVLNEMGLNSVICHADCGLARGYDIA